MRTERFYKLVIILLLLLNTGTLVYLWAGDHRERGHEGPPRPDQIMDEKLQLTREQEDKFSILREDHHSHMLQIQEQSAALHRSLFMLLQKERTDTAAKDSLMQMIQALNLSKEEITFDHFQKLNAILTPGQKVKFDDLVGELSMRILGPHRKD